MIAASIVFVALQNLFWPQQSAAARDSRSIFLACFTVSASQADCSTPWKAWLG